MRNIWHCLLHEHIEPLNLNNCMYSYDYSHVHDNIIIVEHKFMACMGTRLQIKL